MKIHEINEKFDELFNLSEMVSDLGDNASEEDRQVVAETLAYQIEELEHETAFKLENIAKMLKNMELEAQAYKKEIDRMSKKMNTLNNQIDYIKNNLVKPTLERTGAVKAGLFKLSLRKSQAVKIIDEDLIDSKYKTAKTNITISKKMLKDDLKKGVVLGAELVTNQSVQIT